MMKVFRVVSNNTNGSFVNRESLSSNILSGVLFGRWFDFGMRMRNPFER